MSPDVLEKRLLDFFSDAEVDVIDLTGGQDHYAVTVVSSDFEGHKLVEQHRLVYDCLRPELESGEIHALKVSTKKPKKG